MIDGEDNQSKGVRRMGEPEQPQKPNGQNTERKRGEAVQKFIKRNYQWLVLFGSLIVSGTLTARDTFHDEQKSLTEAIESRKEFTRLQGLSLTTLAEIARLQDMNLKSPVAFTGGDRKAHDELVAIVTDLRELRIRVETVRELTGAAPFLIDVSENRVRELEQQLLTEHKEADTRLRSLESGLKEQPSKDELDTRTLSIAVARISSDVSRLEMDVNRAIEEKALDYRHIYVIFSAISYGLISLGVFMSLTAQMIAKPGEAPEIKLG
jgi:hypothetical protein